MQRTSRTLAVLPILFLLAGCGSSGYVKAKGRVVKGGEPFSPQADEIVQMAFFAAGDDASDSRGSYEASFDRSDGSFRVLGKDGKGVPPGKYRVVVRLVKNRKDQFKGAFGVKNSPFLCEVSSTSSDITVDLATPSKPDTSVAVPKLVRKSKK
jgi:hypothetical protein